MGSIVEELNKKTGRNDQTIAQAVSNIEIPSTENPVFTGSISLGRKADTAIGENSSAVGVGVEASGGRAHAEGSATKATNYNSHAEGAGSTASGTQSHAEGAGSTASGAQSHAEGNGSQATGSNSHAEGGSTTASGDNTHAEGANTTASASNSHAEGYGTVASGYNSHASGLGTKAASGNQFVIGKYNIERNDNTVAFAIGNGTRDDDRSDAFLVDWSGNGNFRGDVVINTFGSGRVSLADIARRVAALEGDN